MLGPVGFSEEQLNVFLSRMTSFQGISSEIIMDSGSTDGRPSKLAAGKTTCPHSIYKRDLPKLIRVVVKYRVQLLVSSAGGDGSDDHVGQIVGIVREVLKDL